MGRSKENGKSYRVAAGNSGGDAKKTSSKRGRSKGGGHRDRRDGKSTKKRGGGGRTVTVKMSKAGVRKQAAQIAEAMRARGVRLLAIDWDSTMLDIHTHDRFEGGPKRLAAHARPRLRALARAAARAGVRVAIVSFTQQVELLTKTLWVLFPKLPRARARPYRQDEAPPASPGGAGKDAGGRKLGGGKRKGSKSKPKSPLPSARASSAGSSTSAGSSSASSESKGGGARDSDEDGKGGVAPPPPPPPQRILVRGLDDSWNVPPYSVIPPAWHRAGTKRKVAHLISCVIELASQERGPEAGKAAIAPGECLLLDDDRVNVEHARGVGVAAAWLPAHDRAGCEGALMDELLRVYADGGAWAPLPKPPLCGHGGCCGGGGCALM